jgi:hypothetical protein
MEALQRRGTSHLLPPRHQARREKVKKPEEEEEMRRRPNKMVSTISFIQANLQHKIAASRIPTGAVGSKRIDIALIQEPWFRDGRIRGFNLPGYSIFSAKGRYTPSLYSYKDRDSMDATRLL